MNTLKWLWGVLLLIIGFKVYGLVASPDNMSSNMNSLIGMIFIFAILSGVIIVSWIIGMAKRHVFKSDS